MLQKGRFPDRIPYICSSAAYPSGLRGRFAKPLFVGSNPTAAFYLRITHSYQPAKYPSIPGLSAVACLSSVAPALHSTQCDGGLAKEEAKADSNPTAAFPFLLPQLPNRVSAEIVKNHLTIPPKKIILSVVHSVTTRLSLSKSGGLLPAACRGRQVGGQRKGC